MIRPNTYIIHVDMNVFQSRTAQLSLKYLHSARSSLRNRVKVAIACLYSPLAAAIDGESLEGVKLRIGVSKGSFVAYMALASSSPLGSQSEFKPQQQLDPKQNIIKTSFVENKPAGLGAKYLNYGVIEQVVGVELALICLYGPLSIASFSGNRSEIDTAIAVSRQIFENYMDIALMQFLDSKDFVQFPGTVTKTLEEGKSLAAKSPTPPISQHNLNEGEDDEIDLDEEL